MNTVTKVENCFLFLGNKSTKNKKNYKEDIGTFNFLSDPCAYLSDLCATK